VKSAAREDGGSCSACASRHRGVAVDACGRGPLPIDPLSFPASPELRAAGDRSPARAGRRRTVL